VLLTLNLKIGTGAHQTLTLFSSGDLAVIPVAVASGFIAGGAAVKRTNHGAGWRALAWRLSAARRQQCSE